MSNKPSDKDFPLSRRFTAISNCSDSWDLVSIDFVRQKMKLNNLEDFIEFEELRDEFLASLIYRDREYLEEVKASHFFTLGYAASLVITNRDAAYRAKEIEEYEESKDPDTEQYSESEIEEIRKESYDQGYDAGECVGEDNGHDRGYAEAEGSYQDDLDNFVELVSEIDNYHLGNSELIEKFFDKISRVKKMDDLPSDIKELL